MRHLPVFHCCIRIKTKHIQKYLNYFYISLSVGIYFSFFYLSLLLQICTTVIKKEIIIIIANYIFYLRMSKVNDLNNVTDFSIVFSYTQFSRYECNTSRLHIYKIT